MATEPITQPQVVSSNPATGEVLAAFDCAGTAGVRRAVERARAAQPAWAALDVGRRVRVLRDFQQRLAGNKQEVARLLTLEAGKPYIESLLTEVLVALDGARFCADAAPSFLRPEVVPHGNLLLKAKSGRVVREPYGVIGIISPWNYPLSTPAVEICAALVTGNAVVLKPSEFTTMAGQKLVQLFHEAGLPRDLLQLVPGDGSTGAALLGSALDKVIFTGSVPTGKRVAQAAAARLLPIVLELGGKDPMLVLEDAPLEIAASAAVWGAFMNTGQACLSIERCYVHRAIYDRFVACCVEKTKRLQVGNGMDPNTDIGPMIHPRQLEIVEAHVTEARARGAEVLTGGRRLAELGPTFYPPTIVVDVDHSMRLMREETFGPVLPIMAVADEEEAVRLANDSEFGLAASIWTSDRRRGQRIARQLQAGTVSINDALTGFATAEAPHGGVKASGIGRSHGRLGLEEMVWPKYVDTDLLPRVPKVWWFGYGAKFTRQAEGFIDFLFAKGPVRRMRSGLLALPSMFRKRL